MNIKKAVVFITGANRGIYSISSKGYNSIPVAAANFLLKVDLPPPGFPNTAIFFISSYYLNI